MKHKVLAILLCLAMVLSMTLPGTFAVSADEDGSESLLTTDVCTCGAEDDIHAADCPLYVQPEPSEEEPVCTCGTEDDTHAEDCPLYVAPEEEPICTCGAEDGNHAEDCPLYDAGDDGDAEETTAPTEEEEEEPEGTPPESWGSASLAGAVSFTNVAPLMQFDYSIATLELNDEDYGIAPYAGSNNSGIVLNKTATANTDGSFKITLEAYATGEQTTVSHYDPADIVLVLDTSGSMTWAMDTTDSTQYSKVYTNSVDINKVYYIEENGEFVRVFKVQKSNSSDYYGWCTDAGYSASPRQYVTPKSNANDSGTVQVTYKNQKYTYTKVQFYEVADGCTRLEALKSGVNSFIDSVFTTSADSSIAIVTFGNDAVTASGFTSDATNLKAAVNNLSASGATNSAAAMTTAAGLINSLDSTHDDHKKVVVMFTDGAPCTSGTDFSNETANTAITQSKSLKSSGVTVYTIGVFAGANGNLSSMGKSDVNTYMHSVSSNYPDASNMTDSGDVNDKLNGDSYYLTATKSTDLIKIFQKISEQVGGATNATLDSSTVVKDIIAPSFTVPANTSDVKIYTANCTGAGLTFGNRTTATGVTATIEGDTLNVTGFNFSENWCGSHSGTYSGKKLIIEFTVSPKAGFLGGNNVPTNGNTSGLYSNGTPVGLFEVPTVNVPIADITITASDKNVYLTQVPTEEQLKTGVTIKCGNVDITDPSKLADWRKAYVDIESILTKSDGFNATVDGTYTVTATVNPKVSGDSSKPGTVATKQTGTETKAIHVFKPELTYKDSDVYYGDNAPASYDSNLTKTEWKHGETKSTDSGITMIGTEPTLTLDYIPDATKIKDNKINSKQDIPVDVTVKINGTDVTNKTDFEHTDCTGKTCGTPDNGKFWLHVKTCSLTITKAAGENTTIGTDEYFVFNVKKNGVAYTQVTIKGIGFVTISELPVGSYTVEEDASTAWRYTPTMSQNSVTLSKDNTSGSVTCTNTISNNKWLNHFNQVINTYGKTN